MSSLPSRHHSARPTSRVSRVVPTSSSLFPNSFYGPSTAEPMESPADKGNGRTVPSSAISPALCASRHTALVSYQPKESDPDNEKKTGYIPVWLDDADVLGTMKGIVNSSVDSGHTAAVFLAHPHPYSHAHPTCTHTHSHCPPPLPPSLSHFSLTPNAPRTAFAVASSTTHGRRRWGRRGRWGWGWGWARGGRKLRLTARHAAANNAAPSRTKLARVNSRGVADASPAPRLRLSHRRQAPSRRAMPRDRL
ncbi:hypothetical protein K438DRAFT_2171479 [Mycena galopus ATCC 62051]|nr:hypothetical protein K438DRAFT_2171479 [Mycena galopus ATCC 62051]